MKKSICCIFIFVSSFSCFSQQSLADSLKKIALTVSKDSAAKLYVKVANIFTGVNSDSVRKYSLIAGKLAPPNSIAAGDVLIQMGNSYHMENKMDSALSYFNRAMIYYKKIGSDKGIAKVYQSFSIVKRSMGDYEGSIADAKSAFEQYKKINWTLGMVNVLNNISSSYTSINKSKEAEEYARKAFSFSKLLNDSTKYYFTMSEYGGKLVYTKKVDSAVYYIKKATPFMERNRMYNVLIVSNSNLAGAFWTLYKNTALCKQYYFKALEYARLSGAMDNARYLYRELAMCYMIEKNSDSSQIYFYKTLAVIDSLNQQKALSMTKELQMQYETEKKDLQIKNQSLEITAKEKENAAKNKVLLLGTFALLAVGVFGFIAFTNFRKTQKANLIIHNQKEQVELQKEEITNQKVLVEVKQKEIIDSINYAQKIQSAVLTSEDVWKKISPEYFIIFQPKDIVSGDFYWAYNTLNNRSIFVLADCTGHGVPGGFMSMLGNSFLNELIVENKLFKSDVILNKLRDKIIKALGQKGAEDRKDGMDMALCVWNKLDNTLEFSGANNSLWLIRNNEFITYPGDKMPIGQFGEEVKPFSSQMVQLQKNDLIILCTDGFADQFGGESGKKLKSKSLKEFLIKNSSKPVPEQKTELVELFSKWKGNHQQVDDVSLILVKVV